MSVAEKLVAYFQQNTISQVLTFSHEIIRTGKGALGGREGERRVVEGADQHPFSRKKSKTRKKSKKIGSLNVVDGLWPSSGKKTQG